MMAGMRLDGNKKMLDKRSIQQTVLTLLAIPSAETRLEGGLTILELPCPVRIHYPDVQFAE